MDSPARSGSFSENYCGDYFWDSYFHERIRIATIIDFLLGKQRTSQAYVNKYDNIKSFEEIG